MKHNGKEIRVAYRAFPKELQGKVYGFSMEDDSYWLIIIDESQDDDRKQQTIRHELAHIRAGHHGRSSVPVRLLEEEADFLSESSALFEGQRIDADTE